MSQHLWLSHDIEKNQNIFMSKRTDIPPPPAGPPLDEMRSRYRHHEQSLTEEISTTPSPSY